MVQNAIFKNFIWSYLSWKTHNQKNQNLKLKIVAVPHIKKHCFTLIISIFGTFHSILKIKKNSINVDQIEFVVFFSQNMTSWVLASTAALYWRVEGDASRAIDCLRLALTTASPDVQVSLPKKKSLCGLYCKKQESAQLLTEDFARCSETVQMG